MVHCNSPVNFSWQLKNPQNKTESLLTPSPGAQMWSKEVTLITAKLHLKCLRSKDAGCLLCLRPDSSRHFSFKMSRRPTWTSTFESQHRKMLITFGFQKPYIQRSVWIQKKNTTQRPKNLKLETENWNDKTVRAFSSFCTAYCLSPSSNALLQAQWRMAVCWRPTRRTNTVQRRKRGVSEEGAAQEGRKAATKARILNNKHSSQTKPYGQTAAVLSPLGLPLFAFYNSNKINYKRV